MTQESLDPKDAAIALGAVLTLSAIAAASPTLIIKRLTGCLWTEDEAKTLLGYAAHMQPINDAIINHMVAESAKRVEHAVIGHVAGGDPGSPLVARFPLSFIEAISRKAVDEARSAGEGVP